MYQEKAPVTIGIVGINVIIFLLLSFQGMTEDAAFMMKHGAMYLPDVLDGKYYTIITSIFLHFGFEHLMNNMIIFLLLGWQLENAMGSVRYIFLYLLSGIGGNLLSGFVEMHTQNFMVSAGASGAILGVIGGLLYVALRNHGRFRNVSGRGIIFMIVLSLYHGFTSTGVDNFAHIGGLVTGFLLAVLLYHKKQEGVQ